MRGKDTRLHHKTDLYCFSEPDSAQWEEPHYQEAEASH